MARRTDHFPCGENRLYLFERLCNFQRHAGIDYRAFHRRRQSQWYAKIQLTGAAPYAGLYSLTNFLPLGKSDFVFAGGLGIRFANNLSFAADPLASVEINGVTAAAPTGAAVAIATPIDYVFSNASAVFNGAPESITGSFEFDPLTLIEYDALDPMFAE
jgi:hypothetical protein